MNLNICKDGSQEDKNGSWNDVTSQGQMTMLTHLEEQSFFAEKQPIQVIHPYREKMGAQIGSELEQAEKERLKMAGKNYRERES